MCRNLNILGTSRTENSPEMEPDSRSLAWLSWPWEAFWEFSLTLFLRSYTTASLEELLWSIDQTCFANKLVLIRLCLVEMRVILKRVKFCLSECYILILLTEVCIDESYCAIAVLLPWCSGCEENYRVKLPGYNYLWSVTLLAFKFAAKSTGRTSLVV